MDLDFQALQGALGVFRMTFGEIGNNDFNAEICRRWGGGAANELTFSHQNHILASMGICDGLWGPPYASFAYLLGVILTLNHSYRYPKDPKPPTRQPPVPQPTARWREGRRQLDIHTYK